ncbi:hypothetical protein DIPPA_32647 [Diplonema papillatum]|nr:hypothetical protein DIPPA_32647 [Diplonema papillatum]
MGVAVDAAALATEEVRYAVLCRQPFEKSEARHVLMETGVVQRMHLWTHGDVRQAGKVGKVRQAATEGGQKPGAATAVLVLTVARKHTAAETWACVEKDPHTAMTRLCRRAVKATSAQTRLEAASMWGVTSQQGSAAHK